MSSAPTEKAGRHVGVTSLKENQAEEVKISLC